MKRETGSENGRIVIFDVCPKAIGAMLLDIYERNKKLQLNSNTEFTQKQVRQKTYLESEKVTA